MSTKDNKLLHLTPLSNDLPTPHQLVSTLLHQIRILDQASKDNLKKAAHKCQVLITDSKDDTILQYESSQPSIQVNTDYITESAVLEKQTQELLNRLLGTLDTLREQTLTAINAVDSETFISKCWKMWATQDALKCQLAMSFKALETMTELKVQDAPNTANNK